MRTVSFVAGVAAVVSLASWVSLGCNKSDEPPAGGSVGPVSGEQKIEANEKGFSPSSIVVKKGEATRLVFTRTSKNTCATEVVFPDLGVQKDLPLDTPVSVDIPVQEDKTLRFACGMNMFAGKVVVK